LDFTLPLMHPCIVAIILIRLNGMVLGPILSELENVFGMYNIRKLWVWVYGVQAFVH